MRRGTPDEIDYALLRGLRRWLVPRRRGLMRLPCLQLSSILYSLAREPGCRRTNDDISVSSPLLQQLEIIEFAIHDPNRRKSGFDGLVLAGVAHQDCEREVGVFLVNGVQGFAADVACCAGSDQLLLVLGLVHFRMVLSYRKILVILVKVKGQLMYQFRFVEYPFN